MRYQKINIQNWERKEQYAFFKTFDQPFFSMTANVDISKLKAFSKEQQFPFFYCMLHQILTTINSIPAFKQRLDGNDVIEYEEVHAGVTILKENNSFLFCSVLFQENLEQFITIATASVEEQKTANQFLPHGRQDVIYLSAIPWVAFTSFKNAMQTSSTDCVPRIVVGKFFEENGTWKIPVSVEVHHALVDGFHVGQFYEKLQQNLNNNES